MNSILGKHTSSFSLFLVLSVLAHVLLILTVFSSNNRVSTEGIHDPINLSLNKKREINTSNIQRNDNKTPDITNTEKQTITETSTKHTQAPAQNKINKITSTNKKHSSQKAANSSRGNEHETLVKLETSRTAKTNGHKEAVDSKEIHRSLRRAITANFSYPPLARRRQWEGLVKVSLRIESDGQLSNIQLIKSSGHSILDRAALYSLKRITRLRHHDDWMKGQHFDTVVPIEYRLVSSQSTTKHLRDS